MGESRPTRAFHRTCTRCDVDGDGIDEIVSVSNGSDSGYRTGKIVVLEQDSYTTHISQGTMLDSIGDSVNAIKLVDIDGDGELEIAVLFYGESAYVFESDGIFKSEIFGSFRSLRAGPENQWPPRPLILGGEYGDLTGYGWNGVSFSKLGSLDYIDTKVGGFSLSPWNRRLVHIGSEGRLNILHRSTGNILWQSGYYGWDFGEGVIPLDNGDIATAGSTGVFIFGIR
ncbi:MAG: VCBS repeat-containing protein [Planctomycetes bacterium]|nr:VCBS repeat-containing protein [Planctomycetota bacterium]MCP4771089.1 VCBS repeat-containing protein [Planctomycetota bacterium]MCP4861647.1 VCBS repeat-containing protein [Planctomycetota bacterium]